MPFDIEKNIGLKINRLMLLGFDCVIRNGIRKVRLKCDCGKETSIILNCFLYGKTKSCGCYRNDRNSKENSTHGLSKHILYNTWGKIIQRCENVGDKSYGRYGAKGVTICKEWRNNFKSFYDWAIENGWQKSLKIDKDILSKRLGISPPIYSPQTCCFVTDKVNSNNTRRNRIVKYNNKDYTISELSDFLKEDQNTIGARIRKGWLIEDIVNIPVGKYPGTNRFVKKRKSFINHSFGHIQQSAAA